MMLKAAAAALKTRGAGFDLAPAVEKQMVEAGADRALLAMAVPATISFDGAMRGLRRRWKQWQRLVYPAFLLALAHWVLLDREWGPALVHLAPLLLAWLLRLLAGRGISLRKARA